MGSKQESALQNEILAIHREMACTSMIDEFAKHARLQRRLNKVQEDLKFRGTFILKLLNAIYF
jgi:ribonuclease HIII